PGRRGMDTGGLFLSLRITRADMNFWHGRPTLITGGAGFGGAHLCQQLLQRGARIAVLDQALPPDSYLHLAALADRIHFIQGDIRDADGLKLLCERFQFDTIFHCAAQPIVSISNTLPAETAAMNIMGTYNVLEAMRASRRVQRLVFASSGAYYGATSTDQAIPEDAPPLPAANIYAPTKVAGDIAVRCYAKTYGLKAAVCRWMNTYGPGDTNFSRIVPATIRRLLRGERPLIDGTDGTNVLEMLHVRDMAEGYIAVAERLDNPAVCGEAFNFGSGAPLTLREVAMAITRAWNEVSNDAVPQEPLITGPRVNTIKYLDITKARRLLNWQPRISLDDGLRETVAWYRAHRHVVL
ncbi:MAG: GDP-mannose 4,6-dehydratase, partial [Armatimonadota bacterium]|nr:GDP-mannose 4,6-dehydratase [Armatimonadota bacterium]